MKCICVYGQSMDSYMDISVGRLWGGGERPTLLFHDTSKVSNCASRQVPAQCHSSGDANHTHFHILHFAMQKRVWIARRDSQITSVGAGASLGMRLCKLAVSCHGQCSCNECLMLECSWPRVGRVSCNAHLQLRTYFVGTL